MTDWYKIKRILVWQGWVEKQIYPAGWKPWANTIAYFPFETDATDTQGRATLSNTWTQDTIWYKFQNPGSNVIISWLNNYTVRWYCAWAKLNSFTGGWWKWSYYDKSSMWFFLADGGTTSWASVWIFYTSSYAQAKHSFSYTVGDWVLIWVWYDWTNSVYWVNWDYWIIRASSGYNFWNTFCLLEAKSGQSVDMTYSKLIVEDACWTQSQWVDYYNQTKSNYGL